VNQYLEKAREDYGKHNIDFQSLLGWHLCHGVVLCWPDAFSMGYFSSSSDPLTPCLLHHADTLFATYHAGDMDASLSMFHDQFDFIAFQRSFKGSDRVRLIPMESLKSKLK
jgi:hypothetical protein